MMLCDFCTTALPIFDAFVRARLAESTNAVAADTAIGGGATLTRVLAESRVPLGNVKFLPREDTPKGETAETCSWEAIRRQGTKREAPDESFRGCSPRNGGAGGRCNCV